MKKKLVVIELTIPNASAAGTYSMKGELPKDMSRVVSVGFFEKSAGGLTAYDVSLEEFEGQRIVDPIDRLGLVITGTYGVSVPPEQRRMSSIQFPVPQSNKKTSLIVTTAAATTSEFKLQAVFELMAD